MQFSRISQATNNSKVLQEEKHWEFGITSVIVSIACLVLILFVTCVAVTYLTKTKQLFTCKQDFMGTYLLQFFICNGLFAFTCIPSTILEDEIKTLITLSNYCTLNNFMYILSFSLSINCIVLLMFERYSVASSQSRRRSSATMVKRRLIGLWVISIAISAPILVCDQVNFLTFWSCHSFGSSQTHSHFYVVAIFVSNLLIPTVVILYCCFGLWRSYPSSSALFLKRKQGYQKFTKMISLFTLCYLLGISPTIISSIITEFTPIDIKLNHMTIFLYCIWLFWLSAPCVFQIIYHKEIIWKHSKIKHKNPRLSSLHRRRRSSLFSRNNLLNHRWMSRQYSDSYEDLIMSLLALHAVYHPKVSLLPIDETIPGNALFSPRGSIVELFMRRRASNVKRGSVFSIRSNTIQEETGGL